MPMLIESVFADHQPIPAKFTCDGEDVSPALTFAQIPKNSKSLVLIVDDPDAPHGTFDHWILWNIPANLTRLSEGGKELKGSSNPRPQMGTNGFREAKYRGPCPPPGKPHRYFFKLYALDTFLNLPDGAKKSEVEAAMKGHILEQAQLIGTYQH